MGHTLQGLDGIKKQSPSALIFEYLFCACMVSKIGHETWWFRKMLEPHGYLDIYVNLNLLDVFSLETASGMLYKMMFGMICLRSRDVKTL